MFSAVPPTADIRRERRLRHAESPTLHLGDASMVTVDEIGRVDPSVNDSSTPSARLQIALKRPLIDCQSGYDFAGGNLNSKAVTTAGAMCSRVILRLSEPVVAIPGWLSSTLLALARKLRRRSPKGGGHSLRMIALLLEKAGFVSLSPACSVNDLSVCDNAHSNLAHSNLQHRVALALRSGEAR